MSTPDTAESDIEAEPCVKCGALTLSILEIALGDAVLAVEFICRPCQGDSMEGLRVARGTFQRLLDMGCSREVANRIMCKRIDRAEAERR